MAINPYYNLPQPSYGPPPSSPSSGGGWMQGYQNTSGGGGSNPFGGAAKGAGAGFMVGGPVGAAIGGGLGLLGGIFGGLAKGKKEKDKRKAFQKAQAAYQSKASQLFPDLPRESFQYQNPQLNNAIQAGLMSRMGNMFSSWGMPSDMRGGAGNLNEFFSQAMPGQGQAKVLPTATTPVSRRLPPRGGGGGRGGWREDFRRNRRMEA